MDPQSHLTHGLRLFLRQLRRADLLGAAGLILGLIVKVLHAGEGLHRGQIPLAQHGVRQLPAVDPLLHQHLMAEAADLPQGIRQLCPILGQIDAQRRPASGSLHHAGHGQRLRQLGDLRLGIGQFLPLGIGDAVGIHHLLGGDLIHGDGGA